MPGGPFRLDKCRAIKFACACGMGLWYVREHLRSGLFHIVVDDAEGAFCENTMATALCGRGIAAKAGPFGELVLC